VAGKARQSRGLEPVWGSGSQPESACGVCGGSPQNRQVTWFSHKTKTGGSVGGDRIPALREVSMPGETQRDRGVCVGRTRTAAKVWAHDEKCQVFIISPMRGMYLPFM
jgi:hypothetical protein